MCFNIGKIKSTKNLLSIISVILLSLQVSCSCGMDTGMPDPDELFVLKVIGLRGNAVIQNNNETTTIKHDGYHSFPNELNPGDNFNVSISSYPQHQTYSIDQSQGTVDGSGTIVTISFSNKPFTTSSILAGKKIALSPGHGLKSTYRSWKYQRSKINDLLEDEWTQKVAIQYLIPALERCNAHIINLRERSYDGENYIIDNDDFGFETSGSWMTENRGYLGTHQEHISDEHPGKARWALSVSKNGWSSLYAYFTPDPDYGSIVNYTINHAWGSKTITIDQSHALYFPENAVIKDSGTWYPLGTYYFFADESYSVELSSKGVEPGKIIIADAIRLGGGKGSAKFGNGISGKRQWKQDALSFLQEHNAPDWVLKNDITARPLYALHHRVDAYLSIHANRNSNGGSGTLTFVWNKGNYNIPARESQVSLQTVQLAYLLHDRIVESIKHNWNPDWRDNRIWGSNFGELREIRKAWKKNKSLNVPAVLIELGFADLVPEAELMKNDLFLRDISYAMTKAFIDYFALQKGVKAEYPPPAPEELNSRRTGKNITLTWREALDTIDEKTKVDYYLVYFSTDGKVFNGQPYKSDTNSITIAVRNRANMYFKVTAVNRTGESLDSDIILAK